MKELVEQERRNNGPSASAAPYPATGGGGTPTRRAPLPPAATYNLPGKKRIHFPLSPSEFCTDTKFRSDAECSRSTVAPFSAFPRSSRPSASVELGYAARLPAARYDAHGRGRCSAPRPRGRGIQPALPDSPGRDALGTRILKTHSTKACHRIAGGCNLRTVHWMNARTMFLNVFPEKKAKKDHLLDIDCYYYL